MEKDRISLCSLYGTDGRFVKFLNMTGRTIVLSSRLRRPITGKCLWSAGIVIPNGESFTWKFLGESATIFEDYFLVMPEPYLAARQQGLAWVAEYLDQAWLQDPGGGPTFDTREGPLLLSSLPYLHHGDTVSVVIRRTDKSAPSLERLVGDRAVKEAIKIDSDIPHLVKKHLILLNRKYEDLSHQLIPSCQSCNEIHIFNLKWEKMENFFIKET